MPTGTATISRRDDMYLVPARRVKKKNEALTMGLKGLNRLPATENGELTAMTNISGLYSPVLTSRPPREDIRILTSGTALFPVGDKFCWVDGTNFVYDGTTKGTVTAGKKSIAEYFGIILIFPDKKYYNYVTDTFGSISGCPDIDYICVHNNRAFGCKGNAFYASKLNDPLTWDYFPVEYDDYSSWQANVAEPGNFSGIKVSLNQVKVTKSGYLYELYGDKPANFKLHKVVDVGCNDNNSIVDIDGVLYFMGDNGFRAYSGSVPVPISDKLNEKYVSCVAGTDGRLYYACLYNGTTYNLYVFDTYTKDWWREDDLNIKAFARIEDDLYALAGNKIIKFNSGSETISASIESERFSEWYMGKKVNKTVKVMAELAADAELKIYCSVDDGAYTLEETITTTGFKSYETKITPRRCDSFKVKLAWTGGVKVYGFGRELDFGSVR